MSLESESKEGNSWLEDRLASLDALYRRFGRDGLKDQSIVEVSLLLSAKELAFRDAPKGREQAEQQKAANRQLELEIRDLTGFLNAQLAGANLQASRVLRHLAAPPQQQPFKAKEKGRDHEMGR